MLWVLALHIIAMVAWFAGLFYLPRLFVYHADCHDTIGNARFKIMERRLYNAIMTPAAILTILFGLWLLGDNFRFYMHAHWMQLKLILVFLLIAYHVLCGIYVNHFKHDRNRHSQRFYRIFNELPTVLLIAIVILVVVQPF